MSEAKKPAAGTEVFPLIVTLDAYGRRYTDVRNATLAHVVWSGVKQADIVKATGIDKGNLSRVVKAFNALDKSNKTRRGIQSLDLTALAASVGDATSDVVVHAATLGSNLRRKGHTTNTSKAGRKPAPLASTGVARVAEVDDEGKATGKIADIDIMQFVFAAAMGAPDFAKFKAMVEAALANAESALAKAAAEADIAAA